MKTKAKKNGGKLTQSEGKLEHSDGKLKQSEGKLKQSEGKLKHSEGKLTQSEGKLTQSESKLKHSEGKLTQSEGKLKHSEGKLTQIQVIILLALSSITSKDYIPGPDGDFDEWQKNFISKLSQGWEVGGGTPILREYLGVPDAEWYPLLAVQGIWTDKFAKGGKEANRKKSDTTAKDMARIVYEKALRLFIAERIRGNHKATDDIKRALTLTVPDTEPSPLHSTDAPVVALKALTGGIVDVHCRRTDDGSRSSMIKNYRIEIRFVLGAELPANPDDISAATVVTSSKSHFKINVGITNVNKKMRAYARWAHEHDSQFDSPWSEATPINIS